MWLGRRETEMLPKGRQSKEQVWRLSVFISDTKGLFGKKLIEIVSIRLSYN